VFSGTDDNLGNADDCFLINDWKNDGIPNSKTKNKNWTISMIGKYDSL
jgi:hypothetical protein